MARTAQITLGGTSYTVHPFTIDELEEWTAYSSDPAIAGTGKSVFFTVKMALRRAEPKIEQGGSVEATPAEVRDAFRVITELSGLVDTSATASPQ